MNNSTEDLVRVCNDSLSFVISHNLINNSKYIDELEFKCNFNAVDPLNLKLLSLNIRSLKKNFENLKYLLTLDKHVSVIALTETWRRAYGVGNMDLDGFCFF